MPWGCRGQAWGPHPAPPSSCPGAGDRGPDGTPDSRLVLLGVSPPLPLAWDASSLPSARPGEQPPPTVLVRARGGLSPPLAAIPGLLERGSAVSRAVGPRGLAQPGCLASSSPCPRPCLGWRRRLAARFWRPWRSGSLGRHTASALSPPIPSSTSEQAPAAPSASSITSRQRRSLGRGARPGLACCPHRRVLLAQARPCRHPRPPPPALGARAG